VVSLPGRRDARRVLAVGLVLLFAASCTSGSKSATPPPLTSAPTTPASTATSATIPASGVCTTSDLLVPSCGALMGVSLADRKASAVSDLTEQLGHPVDIVYTFHGIDKPLPTADEKAIVASGATLHLDVESKQFLLPGHPAVKWSDIIAGRWDAQLRAQGAGIAALKVPVMVTFDHEVDSPKKVGPRGTPDQFKQAWRHIRDVYRAAGATNTVWVWVVAGIPKTLDSVAGLYPGNDVVDWISWDTYNASGCRGGAFDPTQWTSFKDSVEPFYSWLQTNGPKDGIDVNKPEMLGEFGTVEDPSDPTAAAQWYAAIPAALQSFPQLKALQLWDSSVGTCDYRINRNALTLKGFGDLLAQPGFAAAARGRAAAVAAG
jgi:Glycosyl hydrolase family 26